MRVFNYNTHKLSIPLVLIATLPIASAQPYACVSNISGNSVSAVNTANNSVTAIIAVGFSSERLVVAAVSPSRGRGAPPLIDIERYLKHVSDPMLQS
jgi:YVTN family beta-propeller protein